MPPKRPSANIGDENPSEGGREIKKQRVIPCRDQLDAVLQDFLDTLSPVTIAALTHFNEKEEEKKRDGVTPVDINRVQDELKALRVSKDMGSLDAKLNDIDIYLKEFQDECAEYIAGTHGNTSVKRKLDAVIWSLNKARSQLPGMFPYWTNYSENLNVTTDRY